MDKAKIIIIGSGPTGIGAAYRMKEVGHTHWQLYEKNDYAGGHCATHADDKGFLWDEGGHVLFSHYKYYDRFISEVLGNDFYAHERESWIKYPDRWIPYPFQNNIRYLDPHDQVQCINGLLDAQKSPKTSTNFYEWVRNTFGQGIMEKFMIPYNQRVWTIPLERMAKQWIADRVSVIDVKRVIENILYRKDDVSWGPNNRFIFPKHGGTGEIFNRAVELFPDHITLSKEVIKIDAQKKIVKFQDRSEDTYDYLLTAMPINELYDRIEGAPDTMKSQAQQLLHNNIFIVGIGLEKLIATTKCWVYFPTDDVPFYRMTYFHNYSPNNVPGGDMSRYSSLMCEVAYSKYKSVNKAKVVDDCIEALIRNGIIEESDKKKIVSRTLYDISYGYPIPTLDRDDILRNIQSWLLKRNIFSRGRYGAWKYEISNMDHCFMQGAEAVDYILNKKQEKIWTL